MSSTKSFGWFDILKEDDPNITFEFEKNMEGHADSIFSLLYFGPPQNKIVSGSRDCTIRIWSSKTGECLKIIEEHSSTVYDLIKWNEESFLSGSGDQTIKCFSISSFKKIKEFKSKSKNCELLKLNEDSFLCRVSSFKLLILSYSENKILKKYYVGHLRYIIVQYLLLSQNYRNCFYISTNDQDETIKMINFEKDEVVKEFRNHNKNEMIRAFCLFFNSKNEEILIACSTSEKIYFYNTSDSQFNKKVKINQIKKWKNEKKYAFPSDNILSCFCFGNHGNRYLLCGDKSGSVHFFEFFGDFSLRKSKQMKVHNQRVYLQLLSGRTFSEFQVLSCSNDKTLKITRITNSSIQKVDESSLKIENEELNRNVQQKVILFEEKYEEQKPHELQERNCYKELEEQKKLFNDFKVCVISSFSQFNKKVGLLETEKEEMKKKYSQLQQDYEELKKGHQEELMRIEKKMETQIVKFRSQKKETNVKLQDHEESMGRVQSQILNQKVEWKEALEATNANIIAHEEKYHRIRIELSSVITKMKQIEENEFSILKDQTYEMEIVFSLISGELPKNAFNFSDLKLQINGEDVDDIMKMPMSFEFDLKFSEVGKYEILMEYKTVKKNWIIHVSSDEIYEEKSKIILKRNDEKCDKFKKNEEIEVFVYFKNEEGLGIPFKTLDGLDFSWKIVPFGSSRKVKGVGGMIDELKEEKYLGEGKVIFGDFSLREEGKFQVVVRGDDFAKKLEFLIV